MKLHEPIDMGCESVDTILHDRESLVHLLVKTAKFESDKPFESCETLINGSTFFCRFLLGHSSYTSCLKPG